MTIYTKCERCNKWTAEVWMDYFTEIGNVCSRCSFELREDTSSTKNEMSEKELNNRRSGALAGMNPYDDAFKDSTNSALNSQELQQKGKEVEIPIAPDTHSHGANPKDSSTFSTNVHERIKKEIDKDYAKDKQKGSENK